jgi:hypothetical protein
LFGHKGAKLSTEAIPLTTPLTDSSSFAGEDWMDTTRQAIAKVLTLQCGLQVESFSSRDDDEVFMKVWGSCTRLLEHAEAQKYKLRLKASLEPMEKFRNYRPYLAYSQTTSSNFEVYEGKLLQDIDQIRLTDSIIREHFSKPYTDIVEAKRHGVLLDYFPVHSQAKLEEVSKLVRSELLRLRVPVHELKDYMGEEFSFYMLWLNFFNSWLALLAGAGFVLVASQQLFGIGGDWGKVLFAGFICVWTGAYHTSWSRQASQHAVAFGSHKSGATEVVRHEFQGTPHISPVTDQPELYFSSRQRSWRQLVSWVVIGLMICLVLGCTISIFLYKATMQTSGKWVGVLSTVQILVFSFLYHQLALKLNHWENYKTEQDYNNAFLVKKIAFQVVNCYVSPFYIAFFKDSVEGCIDYDCMSELNSHLWGMFISKMVFNILEVAQPY